MNNDIRTSPTSHSIELRLRDINQLFNSMDPSPFREKDLDVEAEEFIVGWAREFAGPAQLQLILHLEKPLDSAMSAPTVQDAVRNHFRYRAEQAQWQYEQLLREGWKNLIIGLTFLSLCLFLAQFLGRHGDSTFVAILKEGLIIGGWVSMWRPMEIFLYSRWPLKRKQKLYARLGKMEVHLAIPGRTPDPGQWPSDVQ